MTQSEHDGSLMSDEDVRALQSLLTEQAREIEALSKELAASYRKEMVFLASLASRDRQLKESEGRNLKKIWWLESQWREQGAEIKSLRTALQTVRAQREALRNSVGGRAQRVYWAAQKKILKRGQS